LERGTLSLKKPYVIWCVWRTDSSRVKRSHETYEAAWAEAERLAAANPGKRFVVMQSVRAVRNRVAT
jgi:hypothetical protein